MSHNKSLIKVALLTVGYSFIIPEHILASLENPGNKEVIVGYPPSASTQIVVPDFDESDQEGESLSPIPSVVSPKMKTALHTPASNALARDLSQSSSLLFRRKISNGNPVSQRAIKWNEAMKSAEKIDPRELMYWHNRHNYGTLIEQLAPLFDPTTHLIREDASTSDASKKLATVLYANALLEENYDNFPQIRKSIDVISWLFLDNGHLKPFVAKDFCKVLAISVYGNAMGMFIEPDEHIVTLPELDKQKYVRKIAVTLAPLFVGDFFGYLNFLTEIQINRTLATYFRSLKIAKDGNYGKTLSLYINDESKRLFFDKLTPFNQMIWLTNYADICCTPLEEANALKCLFTSPNLKNFVLANSDDIDVRKAVNRYYSALVELGVEKRGDFPPVPFVFRSYINDRRREDSMGFSAEPFIEAQYAANLSAIVVELLKNKRNADMKNEVANRIFINAVELMFYNGYIAVNLPDNISKMLRFEYGIMAGHIAQTKNSENAIQYAQKGINALNSIINTSDFGDFPLPQQCMALFNYLTMMKISGNAGYKELAIRFIEGNLHGYLRNFTEMQQIRVRLDLAEYFQSYGKYYEAFNTLDYFWRRRYGRYLLSLRKDKQKIVAFYNEMREKSIESDWSYYTPDKSESTADTTGKDAENDAEAVSPKTQEPETGMSSSEAESDTVTAANSETSSTSQNPVIFAPVAVKSLLYELED